MYYRSGDCLATARKVLVSALAIVAAFLLFWMTSSFLLRHPQQPPVVFAQQPEPPVSNKVHSASSDPSGDLGNSIVKVSAEGCQRTSNGSGVVVGPNAVLTNAHIIAGLEKIWVEGQGKEHSATAIWFDPNRDVAVLSVPNLTGTPLAISETNQSTPRHATIAGYPNGGLLQVRQVEVRSRQKAIGRDIYNIKEVTREVYVLSGAVQDGFSGGPVIVQRQIAGLIFARSIQNKFVGYALNARLLKNDITQAIEQQQTAHIGHCAG